MPTIYGKDPTGTARIYAIHIPHGDVAEITEKGKAEGWTELTTNWNPESRLLGQSESSESEVSIPVRKRSSATSGAASRASATRSVTSLRRARRKRS